MARKGPLVGKTAGEVGFRTRYGAAVIAVHRDGTRVQDLPGNIKLQGGDVLLLEAVSVILYGIVVCNDMFCHFVETEIIVICVLQILLC